MTSRGAAIVVVLGLLVAACTGSSDVPVEILDGPMSGVDVVVGGTPQPSERIMSAFLVAALQDRGATVIDRSDTEGVALNRDDLVAGRLDVVPEDIGTGWFIHLGGADDFDTTTELATALRTRDRPNGVEWSDHSSFDEALVAVALREAATDDDGEVISLEQLAQRLSNSFDAVVCVDQETLKSPDGLVRFERATEFTVPAEQLQVQESEDLIPLVASGDCTIAFVPGVDPAIGDAGLVAIDRFAPEGRPQLVFVPRNAAYMFGADFYAEWSPWLGPFLESLMVTLDTETMTRLKAELADGDESVDIARRHLERNQLL
ncbi:MAG: glycine betaine ABC transporter substrate-binding protein [Acidimicrobiales bacterium]